MSQHLNSMQHGDTEALPTKNIGCSKQCHVCDGTHSKTFLPIIFSGAFAFLKSACFGAVLGVDINVDNCDTFVNTLASDANWCRRIFGLKKTTTYNATAFFLQLLSLRLLEFKTRDNKTMICECTQSSNGNYRYEDPLLWKVMAFRTAKRGGALIAFEEVVEKHNRVTQLLNEY